MEWIGVKENTGFDTVSVSYFIPHCKGKVRAKRQMDWITNIVTITEVLGTIAFSISGAMVAIRKRMDLLGVIVLGVTTAVGGGIIRDVLLGHTPPRSFVDPTYVVWALISAMAVFVWVDRRWHEKSPQWLDSFLNVVDAVGLGIFAVMGVRTAIHSGYGDNAFLSIFVGVLSGVGGGLLRDMMAGVVPKIFRKRVYAVAALIGAMVYYYTLENPFPETTAMIASSGLVVCIRLLATHFEWNLPRARYGEAEE